MNGNQAFAILAGMIAKGGGGGGTSDHRYLLNRDAMNQHPTSAIEGLDAQITDLKIATGLLNDPDIAGIEIDYVNKTFTRVHGAAGLSAGSDFNKWNIFGGRMRCNVADDGTINAWYGDADYAEDGSNGQVMLYQPKVYYKRIPLKLDNAPLGHHIRKEQLLVSDTQKPGFKLHPAFYDANGNEIEYVLMSAYEGSVYNVSASSYVLNDAQTTDFEVDKICSIANAKPMSGLTQNLKRANVEKLAQNRGENWHGDLIKLVSLNQLLMAVELGTLNTQTAIESGVISIPNNSAYNCSSLTGSTSTLGNATGAAASTVNEIGGTTTTYSVAGRRSVSYRGMENPWGNLWKFVYGINIHGNGLQGGGIPYICTDFNFEESKNSGNYESAGFQLPNADGYISAFGYGEEKYDWLFIPSETGANGANSSLPVGDYFYTASDLDGYRAARMGGHWTADTYAGGFCWDCHSGVSTPYRSFGGRAAYVPVANSASYDAAVEAWTAEMEE